MHTGLVDHTNLTLPVGADAYIPARHDAQPVCARPPVYAAAGIAERFSDNTQPLVGSTWPRLNEGVTYTQPQPAPSSTQPLYLAEQRQRSCSPKIFGLHCSLVL